MFFCFLFFFVTHLFTPYPCFFSTLVCTSLGISFHMLLTIPTECVGDIRIMRPLVTSGVGRARMLNFSRIQPFWGLIFSITTSTPRHRAPGRRRINVCHAALHIPNPFLGEQQTTLPLLEKP
jgi:hypothetical protein